MDQDLENLWLDRFVLSAPQIEDILRGWQDTRDELKEAGDSETRDELEGRISELESDLGDARDLREAAENALRDSERYIAQLETDVGSLKARVAELEMMQ